MNKLVILQHGSYDDLSGHLTGYGREQITDLTARLFPLLSEEERQRVLVFASMADRANESAEIVAELLKSDVIQTSELGDADGQRVEEATVLALVQLYENRAEVLILVTHLSTVGRFLPFYMSNVLGVHYSYSQQPRRGQAALIDIATKLLYTV